MKRFDPSKLDRLNNPERLKEFPLDFIIKHTSLKTPDIIIDLGAGTGFFSIQFAEKYTDCKIFACDISDVMIDWMKNNIIQKHENIVPLKMEDNNILLESNIADFLFMINLHHELDKPEEMLKECYRLLKSNGTIAISDWRKEESDRGPSIEIRYEPDQVKEQLIVSGFKNVKTFIEFPNNFLVIAEK